MGSERCCLIIIIFMVLSSLLSSIVGGSGNYDPEALDALFYYYANQTIAQHRTGTLNRVSLPSNFSGMEVSAIRLRSGSLWGRGTNSSLVQIPPRVITLPYVRRVAIVYDNLGEWSSKYYHVPGYSLISPVVGFNVYDSTNLTTLDDKIVTLSAMGEPISIYIPHVEAEDTKVTELKCVQYGAGGTVQVKNITGRNICLTATTGHFSVLVSSTVAEKKDRIWKWWVIGFVAGTVGLVTLILVGVATVRTWKRMKIKTMEKESDTAVALDTFWVGGDKMPSASMIRTQPVLEQDCVP